jgi:hypothetical protein
MTEILCAEWYVTVNGAELDSSRKSCISSIDIQEICDGSDMCTISVSDPDMLFIEDDIFIEDAPMTASIILSNGAVMNFSGFIAAIDIDFPADGYPAIKLTCIDETHLMNRKKKKRTWSNTTSAEVVKKIAKEYGFKCVVEKGYKFKTQETISQSDTTDIEFCEGLSKDEREPFMCKLKDSTLYYVKKGLLKDPVCTLSYKEAPFSLISFSPRIDKETRKEEVNKSDIDTNSKMKDSATASDSDTSRDVQGGSVKTSSKPTYPRWVYDVVQKKFVQKLAPDFSEIMSGIFK